MSGPPQCGRGNCQLSGVLMSSSAGTIRVRLTGIGDTHPFGCFPTPSFEQLTDDGARRQTLGFIRGMLAA